MIPKARLLIEILAREDDPMATAEALMTAKEFGLRPDPGHPEELIQGMVTEMPPPDRKHAYVCGPAYYLLRQFIELHDLGRVMCNDSGVITERNPDTVRGADVAYYSYARLPKGPLTTGYGPEVPELVVEVCSASDRWVDIHEKVAEYLRAGVLVVLVLDPNPQTAYIFSGDDAPRTLTVEDELVLPGLLEGFQVRVGRFFE
jgi:Uma2 family endonuclease